MCILCTGEQGVVVTWWVHLQCNVSQWFQLHLKSCFYSRITFHCFIFSYTVTFTIPQTKQSGPSSSSQCKNTPTFNSQVSSQWKVKVTHCWCANPMRILTGVQCKVIQSTGSGKKPLKKTWPWPMQCKSPAHISKCNCEATKVDKIIQFFAKWSLFIKV